MNILNINLAYSLKIGPHHRFGGVMPFQELLNEHESCFAYVTGTSNLDEFKTAAKGVRDLDLLEESLGMCLRSQF